MKENIVVKIRSIYSSGEISSSAEKYSPGFFYFDKETYFYEYSESLSTEEDISHVLLKVTGECVTMIRRGKTVSAEMHFMNRHNHEFCYETPYGNLKMKLYTSDIMISIGENGCGRISIHYDLFTGNTCGDKHILYIEFLPINDK